MRKHAVVLGTSNHLPEGSPQTLFEETYQICWRPWLSTLYRFPELASTVHYSGSVLAWLQSHHPEFIMLLEEMSSRKQVEVVGGGYFAPIMPIIPVPDRVGQLELLSTLVRKLLGRRPRGVWLQEFAWEPSLVSTFNACGFDYTFLPASLFSLSGLDPSYPVTTEDQGKNLCVFPIIDRISAGKGLADPGRILTDHFRDRKEGGVAVLMVDDSKLIEYWKQSDFESPDVLFEAMFASIRKEGETCETVLPSRWMRSMEQPSRGYFPCSCSLDLARASSNRRSGAKSAPAVEEGQGSVLFSPRRLLLRHPESHALYAKMQFVRILVGQLRGDKSRKKSAQEEVWRAQCGDAYWAGNGGGIRSLPIRSAAWSALIEAERSTRHKGSFVPGIIRADIDLDGQKEILFQGLNYNAHVRLGEAALAEFDSFRSLTNYVNAMDESARDSRLECFIDRIGAPGVFNSCESERGAASYTLLDGGKPSMTASFTGSLTGVSRRGALVLGAGKIYSFRRDSLGLSWSLSNEGSEDLSFRFATELNLSAARNGHEVLIRFGDSVARGDEKAEAGPLSSFIVENASSQERLEFRSDRPYACCLSPLSLKAGDEADASWQGTRVLLGWDLKLAPGAVENISLTLELARL